MSPETRLPRPVSALRGRGRRADRASRGPELSPLGTALGVCWDVWLVPVWSQVVVSVTPVQGLARSLSDTRPCASLSFLSQL